MYILLNTKDTSVLTKIRKYLKNLGLLFKEFNDTEYRVEVTAEERFETHRGDTSVNINPPRAWKTCASCVQIWDWDSLGRGPDGFRGTKNDTIAPRGKGFILTEHGKIRVAGECENPTMLNYISCPKSCTKYQPRNIEAAIYVAEQVAEEHERRARKLRGQIEFLKTTDLQYREVIKTGGAIEYKDGKYIIHQPDKE